MSTSVFSSTGQYSNSPAESLSVQIELETEIEVEILKSIAYIERGRLDPRRNDTKF